MNVCVCNEKVNILGTCKAARICRSGTAGLRRGSSSSRTRPSLVVHVRLHLRLLLLREERWRQDGEHAQGLDGSLLDGVAHSHGPDHGAAQHEGHRAEDDEDEHQVGGGAGLDEEDLLLEDGVLPRGPRAVVVGRVGLGVRGDVVGLEHGLSEAVHGILEAEQHQGLAGGQVHRLARVAAEVEQARGLHGQTVGLVGRRRGATLARHLGLATQRRDGHLRQQTQSTELADFLTCVAKKRNTNGKSSGRNLIQTY